MDLELSTYGLRPTSDDLQFTTDELRLRSGEIPAEVENIQSKALSHVESRKSTLESRHSQVRSHKSQIGNPFLFSIGIHPKKNYHVLMPLLAENKQYKWIIAGPDSRGYKGKIEQEAAKFGLSDRIEFCGPVDDKEKLEYYQNCTALLFPSLSEGFGLPVVEAMSIGKPVFLSNRTSLPEIGGSEAYYFKDFEPKTLNETFTSGMKNFENDPEKPQRMKTWATQFTWEKAAKQYIEFYQDLLKVHH